MKGIKEGYNFDGLGNSEYDPTCNVIGKQSTQNEMIKNVARGIWELFYIHRLLL